ncbi:MAG: FAD-dependent monooxygenase [Polyangiales bacterium]
MNDTSRSDLRVLIAGAGIGGLTLAAALRHHGLAAEVYERAPLLAPVGAGITIQMNAMLALRGIGLDAAVEAEGRVARESLVLDPSGRTLSALDLAGVARDVGAPAVAIHRARLQHALRRSVPDASVHLGRAVRAARDEADGVVAVLDDGTEVRGDVLVAADGLRSAVRKQVVGDGEPQYAGYTSWRGIARGVDGISRQRVTETWGPGRRFGVVPLAGDEVYWFATQNAPAGERETLAAQRAGLLARFGRWHDPIPALLAATRDDDIVRTDIADRAPIVGWVTGRVALLGDAAHPMTPNLGQGGCQAIEDAVVLAALLARRGDVAEALRRYASLRVERANAVVVESRRVGRAGQLEHGLARAARDLALRAVPSALARRSIVRAMHFAAPEG